MAKGLSLHIGLNNVDPTQYQGWSGTLRGCEADARDMQALVKSRDFETQILLTGDATSDRVIATIMGAAQRLNQGDIFCLSYSGHGGQVPDLNGDETKDNLDETWVLYDRELIDDELYALWGQFKRGVRIFVISDSCHSGSILRAVEYDTIVSTPSLIKDYIEAGTARSRAMPERVQAETYARRKEMYDAIQQAHPSTSKTAISASVHLLSGCQDEQLSQDGLHNGLFTQTLLEVWDHGNFHGNYQAFYRAITKRMPSWQHPARETVGAKNPAFLAQTPFTI